MIIAPGWADLLGHWAGAPVTIAVIHANGPVTTATVTARERKYFCKTAPLTDLSALQLLHIEAAATAVHQHAAAPFHGLLQGHGWAALLFDFVDGEHPRFHPPDTGLALAETIADLITTPTGTTTATGLPTIADRIDSAPTWKTLVHDHPWLVQTDARDYLIDGQDQRMRQLGGDHIAHTDIHPYNVIVNDQKTTIVDWGWAAAAPPWFDQAVIGTQLIGTGAPADTVIRSICDDRTGHPCSPDELLAFAIEMTRYWTGRLIRRPQHTNLSNLISAANQLTRSLSGPTLTICPPLTRPGFAIERQNRTK